MYQNTIDVYTAEKVLDKVTMDNVLLVKYPMRKKENKMGVPNKQVRAEVAHATLAENTQVDMHQELDIPMLIGSIPYVHNRLFVPRNKAKVADPYHMTLHDN